jgi:serine/threonine protein kinase
VCVAYCESDGAEVAAKVFEDDEDLTALLETFKELAVISALSKRAHPNIVELLDICFEFDGRRNCVVQIMPLMCCSLESQIGAGSLVPERRLRLLWQIAHAFDFLHACSIMHRDFKPGNVVLCSDLERAVVIDFSFARRVSCEPEAPCRGKRIADGDRAYTDNIGTPAYTAPEILERKPYGLSSDIWSLGVCALELLQDRPMDIFKDKAAFRHIQKTTADMGSKPAALLLKAMLRVDPVERCTAQEVLTHKLFDRLAGEAYKAPPPLRYVSFAASDEIAGRAKAACALLGYNSAAATKAAAFLLERLPGRPDVYAAVLAGKLYEESPFLATEIRELGRGDISRRRALSSFSADEYAGYEIEALRACGGNVFWDLQCV